VGVPPSDYSIVEGAVKIIYTKIYAPLNKQGISHSLVELNTAIWQALKSITASCLKVGTTAVSFRSL